ncbi:MAG: hypothetical protein HY647_05795 [Acidobacteria bacterium]|nr:hypothetical protein [Acidobacteriota bacterium]
MLLLVAFSAWALWKQNDYWAHAGEASKKATADFAAALEETTKGRLVILWAPSGVQEDYAWYWYEALPYPFQEPFTSRDLYQQVRIIEFPRELYCCQAQWWPKAKDGLTYAIQGVPAEEVEIHLLFEDGVSQSVQRKKRFVTKGALRATVESALESPLGAVETVQPSTAERLGAALIRLITYGSEPVPSVP